MAGLLLAQARMTLILTVLFIIAAGVCTLALMPYIRQPHAARFKALLIACMLITGSFALYLALGDPLITGKLEAREAETAELLTEAAKLREAIAGAPGNPLPHAELGRVLIALGEYEKAGIPLKRAVQLSQGTPEILLLYARSLTLAEGGNVTADAKKAYEMVLLQQPESPEARFFLAAHLRQNGNRDAARAQFKTLAASLPAGEMFRGMAERNLELLDAEK